MLTVYSTLSFRPTDDNMTRPAQPVAQAPPSLNMPLIDPAVDQALCSTHDRLLSSTTTAASSTFLSSTTSAPSTAPSSTTSAPTPVLSSTTSAPAPVLSSTTAASSLAPSSTTPAPTPLLSSTSGSNSHSTIEGSVDSKLSYPLSYKANADGRLQCDFCPDSYASKAYLHDHYDREHRPNRIRYQCQKCSESFDEVTDYAKHLLGQCKNRRAIWIQFVDNCNYCTHRLSS